MQNVRGSLAPLAPLSLPLMQYTNTTHHGKTKSEQNTPSRKNQIKAKQSNKHNSTYQKITAKKLQRKNHDKKKKHKMI